MPAIDSTMLVISDRSTCKIVRAEKELSKRDRATSLQLLHDPIALANMSPSLGRMFLNMLRITNTGQPKDDIKSHEEDNEK